jgi:hypothetical protein
VAGEKDTCPAGLLAENWVDEKALLSAYRKATRLVALTASCWEVQRVACSVHHWVACSEMHLVDWMAAASETPMDSWKAEWSVGLLEDTPAESWAA